MSGRARLKNFIAEAFVWMVLGFFVEVCVTATVERASMGDRYVLANVPWYSFQGHTTMWNVFNGVLLAAILRQVVRFDADHWFSRTWWGRGLFTVPLIYVGEFLGGCVFNLWLGFDLWDYSQYEWHGHPLHVWGQITVVYAPFWFLAGVAMPYVYNAVHGIAPYVGKQLRFVRR